MSSVSSHISHISSIVAAMKATTAGTVKTAFFVNKPLDADPGPLKAQGVSTTQPVKGSVVSLTRIATGLVYDVSCTANGNGPNTSVAIGGGPNGDVLRNVALITNCSPTVNATARNDNALVVTTRLASASVLDAAEGAQTGDPPGNCDLSKKVSIMAASGVAVNPNLAASNVAFVADGDIDVAASSSSSGVAHKAPACRRRARSRSPRRTRSTPARRTRAA